MKSINIFEFRKTFGKYDYQVTDNNFKEKVLNHPLYQSLWTIGPSFIIITNTHNFRLEMVGGDTELITGYSHEEILELQDKFILNFPIQDHARINFMAARLGMEYISSRPEAEREKIFVVYFYNAKNQGGEMLTIQHQSFPLVFDDNKIPYVFLNIFSDIRYLNPSNIPLCMVINRHINETFNIEVENEELVRANKVFTDREKEIIQLLFKGQNSSEIADSLSISSETVRTHRKNILKKAGVNNTNQLIHYCLMNGII